MVVGLLAIILSYYFIVFDTAFVFPLFLITPSACWLMFLPYQPIDSLILCLGLLWPIYHIFTSHQFMGLVAIISTMSAHLVYHFIPWASLAHLLILYLFLLPWVCCLIPWAFSTLLLHPYLSLLLWAYLPSFLPCQPIEFTTLFLGLPRLIYFFFTSYYFHRLTTSFLGYPRPIYFFFTSYYFHELVGYQSYHFNPLGLFPNFFTVLPLVFFSFSYCWASSAVGPFVKNGHQHNLYHKTK